MSLFGLPELSAVVLGLQGSARLHLAESKDLAEWGLLEAGARLRAGWRLRSLGFLVALYYFRVCAG